MRKTEENPIHRFFQIQDGNAYCKTCRSLLAYKSSAYATGLMRHLKNVPGHEESYNLFVKLKNQQAKKREQRIFLTLNSMMRVTDLPFCN